ncbi:hypothetical protein SDC9_69949 [bioreactor metagenome]|uniref:DUF4179 domain-containing protein n=1 Tax=bioreactor metagenome TaxID=1076179 RepID=A0A644Y4I4_9ZZZZ|nr:hypothetical protein [Christensenella sp.]
MQTYDNTLDRFLYENRVSPTPEFSARIDAFCGQLQRRAKANGRRTSRSTRKQRRARALARRILLAAACLLFIAAVSVLAVPSARAAVSDWISGWFSAGEYMGQTSEKRASEPALDSVIKKIGDDGREIVLSNVYGSDEARSMAENFGIRLDEVAYTGDTIYITGWFTGTSGKFLLDARTGGDTMHEGNEFTEGNMVLTLADGTVYYGSLNAYFDDEMEQLIHDNFEQMGYDENDNLVNPNDSADADAVWYDYLKTHEVRFTYTAIPESAVPTAKPLSGKVEAALTFEQYYYDVKSDSKITLFQADLGSVTIDADAYAAVTTEQSGGKSVSLSGTHRMFIRESVTQDGQPQTLIYVKDMDMSGVTISVDKLNFIPTGLEITLRMDVPERWTRAERIAAIQGGETRGIGLAIYIDGQEIRHAFLSISAKYNADTDNKDDPFLTSPITFTNSTLSRSQWDSYQTISFVPYCVYPTQISGAESNGAQPTIPPTKIEPGTVITLPGSGEENTRYTGWQEDRMEEFALTIQLNDYR